MKAIILIVSLLVFTKAMTQISFVEQFKAIDEQSLGRYIINTLFMQLEQGQELDRLLQTLSDLEDQYNADQKEEDATNRKFQDVCDGDIANYDKDIAQSDTLRIQLEAKLEGELIPLKEIQEEVVKTKTNELRQYKKDLDELDGQRLDENEVFEQKIKEHHEAATIITEAKRLFEDNLEAPSFMEKKQKQGTTLKVKPEALVEIQNHLKQYKSRIETTHKYKKAYSSILQVLITITSRVESTVDHGSIQRIINLCEEILSKISSSVDTERFAEDQRVKAYEKFRYLLVRNINICQSILSSHESELASIVDRITSVQANHSDTVQRLETSTDQRKERYEECEEAAFDYKASRSSNDKKKQLVSDIIGLVNANLRWFKEQVALRIAAGDIK